MKRFKVAVLGATGAVGQRFISLLHDHPRFELTEVVASERSAKKTYADAAHWVLDEPMPDAVKDMRVKLVDEDLDADVCFSAIPAGKAGPEETRLAERGYKVFSNARDHRYSENVPLMIPEVNPEHMALVDRQGTDGFIVTNGNCVGIPLAMALKPLHDAFGVEAVNVVTFQAVSGAGYPGVPSLDILGNVVPHIGGEEEKVQKEPLKVLGTLTDDGIREADIRISASCVRVPVQEGHTLAIHAKLGGDPSVDDVKNAIRSFRGRPQELGLHLAPQPALVLHEDASRPQPKRDVLTHRGMACHVGRVREDPLATVRFFAAAANTVRGAAGCSILNAELFAAEGRLD